IAAAVCSFEIERQNRDHPPSAAVITTAVWGIRTSTENHTIGTPIARADPRPRRNAPASSGAVSACTAERSVARLGSGRASSPVIDGVAHSALPESRMILVMTPLSSSKNFFDRSPQLTKSSATVIRLVTGGNGLAGSLAP